jgi:hypothetical protein
MRDARVTSPAARASARLILVACAMGPAAAHAQQAAPVETREKIGVLEVATSGLSEAAGDRFEQKVEETLAQSGVGVVRSKTVKQALIVSSYMAGCTFGPCLKEVFKRTGLRRVLVARIQGAGQSYSVIVSLLDTETGNLLAQVATPCPACTVDEAIATGTLSVVQLLTRGDAASAAGAQALTPARAAAPSGDGERLAAARLERRRRQLRRAGWVFVAGGAVAAGLGGALIATDQGDAGVASAALGGGLAVAGVTALIWSSSF